MTNENREEQICRLMEAQLGWKRGSAMLTGNYPPFDITRPNIHDSKKDFLTERDVIQGVVGHLDSIIRSLLRPKEEETPEHQEMINRIAVAVEMNARLFASRDFPQNAGDLARRNVLDTGYYHNSLILMIELLGAYKKRLSDLKEQEEQFWNVPHRAPNYYARTIALRFARFYAHQTGRRPTFGVSSEWPHPSTEYGRILEEIFSILGIKANIRGAAEWAIPQVTDEDVAPPEKYSLGGLLGLPVGDVPRKSDKDIRAEIAAALSKKGS